MRLGHARGLACAKTKKFPCIFLASPPPTPPPRSGKRNGKEIFGFASPFQSPKRASLFYHVLIALFSALTATEAPPYPRLVVILMSTHTSQTPRIGRSHSLTMPAQCCLCSLCGFVRVCGNSRKQFALSASKSICACPTRPVRAQQPLPFLGNIIKRRGLLP